MDVSEGQRGGREGGEEGQRTLLVLLRVRVRHVADPSVNTIAF